MTRTYIDPTQRSSRRIWVIIMLWGRNIVLLTRDQPSLLWASHAVYYLLGHHAALFTLSPQQSRTRLQNVQLTHSANPDFDLDPADCKTLRDWEYLDKFSGVLLAAGVENIPIVLRFHLRSRSSSTTAKHLLKCCHCNFPFVKVNFLDGFVTYWTQTVEVSVVSSKVVNWDFF